MGYKNLMCEAQRLRRHSRSLVLRAAIGTARSPVVVGAGPRSCYRGAIKGAAQSILGGGLLGALLWFSPCNASRPCGRGDLNRPCHRVGCIVWAAGTGVGEEAHSRQRHWCPWSKSVNVETWGHVPDPIVMAHTFAELGKGTMARARDNRFKSGRNLGHTLYSRADTVSGAFRKHYKKAENQTPQATKSVREPRRTFRAGRTFKLLPRKPRASGRSHLPAPGHHL